MISIFAIAVRVFLLLFGAVVLGLSVTLAKQQAIGSPPSQTSFSSFVGAFGILVSILGLVSLKVEKLSPMIIMVVDALASIFYLAAGIAMTLALKSVSSCTSTDAVAVAQRFYNSILNGGCVQESDGLYCYAGTQADNFSPTVGRCQRAQADYVFEFLAFLFGLASIGLGFMAYKRGGLSSSRTYV
ncbi:marvel domain-containing protein [Xylariales sp. PMI_506]|nr:marvel domain-containing protein [Xylariales sp. PMI_506]